MTIERSRRGLSVRGEAIRGGKRWVALLILANWCGGGWGCDTRPAVKASSATPSVVAAPTNSLRSVADVARSADRRAILGTWQRADGDYVLEIRQLDDATGKLEASYLNPRPIHVSRAEAVEDGGKVKVLIELNDVNYPGCTYRLTHFPQTDQLYGVYYQAALGESYDVEFSRRR